MKYMCLGSSQNYSKKNGPSLQIMPSFIVFMSVDFWQVLNNEIYLVLAVLMLLLSTITKFSIKSCSFTSIFSWYHTHTHTHTQKNTLVL